MFRWYQRASKCYVYLLDVVISVDIINAEDYPIAWRQAFRRSRWFTRGWTLQELVAPSSVKLFSKDSKRLGSQISLEQELYNITKLPVRVLRGQPLTKFSVKEQIG
jgi:hypothetical protein